MAQQGPGGFGGGGYGGPPGGYGPPGGAPPGGYGPPGGAPPGGYGPPGGGPPGGYGPPGGGPPGGYGPPGGGGPGGYGPPGGAPGQFGAPVAKKKSNVALWLGLGCGGLLLLSAVGSAVVYYALASAADELTEQAVKVTSGNESPASTSTSSSGSGTCEKATACCKAVVQKSGGDAAALAGCDNFKQVPELGCAQSLDTFKKSAAVLGVSCE